MSRTRGKQVRLLTLRFRTPRPHTHLRLQAALSHLLPSGNSRLLTARAQRGAHPPRPARTTPGSRELSVRLSPADGFPRASPKENGAGKRAGCVHRGSRAARPRHAAPREAAARLSPGAPPGAAARPPQRPALTARPAACPPAASSEAEAPTAAVGVVTVVAAATAAPEH